MYIFLLTFSRFWIYTFDFDIVKIFFLHFIETLEPNPCLKSPVFFVFGIHECIIGVHDVLPQRQLLLGGILILL